MRRRAHTRKITPGEPPVVYTPTKLAANVANPAGNNQTKAQVEALNAQIAPRKLDRLMFFSTFAETALRTYMETLSEETATEEIILAWLPDPAGGTFNAQVMGGAYDAYFEAQLAIIKAWGKPVILRVCHELNGNWHTTWGTFHETAAQHIEAWKKLYALIHEKGGPNVSVAWNPNTWAGASAQDPTTYFPGTAFVDIIGLDSYMKAGETAKQPAEMFTTYYESLKALAPTKPFYIFETGCCPSGEDKNGVLNKAAWFSNLSALGKIIPITGLGYWDRHKEGEDDFTIDTSGTDPTALAAFKAMVNNPRFV